MENSVSFGNCPFPLRICYACGEPSVLGSIIANPVIIDEQEHKWWSTLQCGRCEVQWFICTICPRMRSHMKTFANLRNHYRLHHDKRCKIARKKNLNSPRQIEEAIAPLLLTAYRKRKNKKMHHKKIYHKIIFLIHISLTFARPKISDLIFG